MNPLVNLDSCPLIKFPYFGSVDFKIYVWNSIVALILVLVLLSCP